MHISPISEIRKPGCPEGASLAWGSHGHKGRGPPGAWACPSPSMTNRIHLPSLETKPGGGVPRLLRAFAGGSALCGRSSALTH